MRFILALALVAAAFPAPAADRKPPYWASIAAGEARMRTGPSLTYPATWLYKRRDLPIRVIGTFPSWRKVQDPSGQIGWMLVSLLSDTRTAIVVPGRAKSLRKSPTDTARQAYRVKAGTVGRLSDCANGWCRLEVAGRGGFIRNAELWGVDPRETLD